MVPKCIGKTMKNMIHMAAAAAAFFTITATTVQASPTTTTIAVIENGECYSYGRRYHCEKQVYPRRYRRPLDIPQIAQFPNPVEHGEAGDFGGGGNNSGGKGGKGGYN